MRKLLAFPIIALAGVAGCAMPAHAPALPPAVVAPAHTPKPGCQDAVILVDEEAETLCDVSPPQRLDVQMLLEGDPIGRCLDMGGEPISQIIDGPITCEGVDY